MSSCTSSRTWRCTTTIAASGSWWTAIRAASGPAATSWPRSPRRPPRPGPSLGLGRGRGPCRSPPRRLQPAQLRRGRSILAVLGQQRPPRVRRLQAAEQRADTPHHAVEDDVGRRHVQRPDQLAITTLNVDDTLQRLGHPAPRVGEAFRHEGLVGAAYVLAHEGGFEAVVDRQEPGSDGRGDDPVAVAVQDGVQHGRQLLQLAAAPSLHQPEVEKRYRPVVVEAVVPGMRITVEDTMVVDGPLGEAQQDLGGLLAPGLAGGGDEVVPAQTVYPFAREHPPARPLGHHAWYADEGVALVAVGELRLTRGL